MEKIKIEKIIVDLGGEKVELTLDQARKLNEILGEMFDEKTAVHQPAYPIIIERQNPYAPLPWTAPGPIYWEHPQPSWISNHTGVPMSLENNTVCLEIESGLWNGPDKGGIDKCQQ